jgi:hypothetical protein
MQWREFHASFWHHLGEFLQGGEPYGVPARSEAFPQSDVWLHVAARTSSQYQDLFQFWVTTTLGSLILGGRR